MTPLATDNHYFHCWGIAQPRTPRSGTPPPNYVQLGPNDRSTYKLAVENWKWNIANVRYLNGLRAQRGDKLLPEPEEPKPLPPPGRICGACRMEICLIEPTPEGRA